MKATIIKVNHKRGLAIFEREDFEYGWLEIVDTVELEDEEIVFGDFSNLGETTIKKDTGETIDIFIEDFCSLKVAMSKVFP